MNDDRLEALLREAAGGDLVAELPGDFAARIRRRLARRRQRRRIAAGSGTALLLLALIAGAWQATTRRVGTAHHSTENQVAPTENRAATVRERSVRERSVAENPAVRSLTVAAPTSAAPTPAAPTPAPSQTAAAGGQNAEAVALRAQVARLREDIARLEERIKLDEARRQFEKCLAARRRELAKPDPRDLAAAEFEKTAFLVVRRAETCTVQDRRDEARQEYEQVLKLFPNTSLAKVAQHRLNKEFPESSNTGEK